MLWDIHLHTSFSGDSDANSEEMVQSAMEKGLSGMCFTDHMDLDFPYDDVDFTLDLEKYLPHMKELQAKYSDRFPILIGMELGLQPQLADIHRNLLEKYSFDYIIGSSHLVHGLDPYYPEYFKGRSDRDGFMEYFYSILENLDVYDDFDVYGHIDYIVRYAPEKNANYSYREYRDIIDDILRRLISMGKGIEINTGGFKYGLGHPNPTEDIIRHYRELGGEIITLGSDAHTPEHVAYDFQKLPAILKECGFDYYTIFRNRKPEFIKI